VQENHNYYKLLNSGVSATESLGAFEYGKHVGIAFQLVDDLLDFVASADQLGIGRPNRNKWSKSEACGPYSVKPVMCKRWGGGGEGLIPLRNTIHFLYTILSQES
jgi:hypothetical protein